MQPCFTPAKQVKASVNLLSILTADLSFEFMDIKTSRKRTCTPSFLSLSNSFCRGIQSKAFLKSTKHEKSKFHCFRRSDFTYLSISIFNVKMLLTVPCIFLKPPLVRLSGFLFVSGSSILSGGVAFCCLKYL